MKPDTMSKSISVHLTSTPSSCYLQYQSRRPTSSGRPAQVSSVQDFDVAEQRDATLPQITPHNTTGRVRASALGGKGGGWQKRHHQLGSEVQEKEEGCRGGAKGRLRDKPIAMESLTRVLPVMTRTAMKYSATLGGRVITVQTSSLTTLYLKL